MTKKIMCTFFLLLAVIVSTSCAFETSGLEIDHVEFYPTGARVRFLLPDTELSEIILPGTFQKDSFNYEASGDAVVTKFKVKEEPASEWHPDSLKSLRDEIEELDHDRSILLAEIKGLHQTIKHLDSYPLEELAIMEIEAVLLKIQDHRTNAESELKSKQKELKEIETRLSVLEKKYQSMIPPYNNRFYRITLVSKGPGRIYLLAWSDHARWAPEYDMHLDSSGERINIDLRAVTFQRTGIDITGEFTFNTVVPQRTLTHPELNSEVVDFNEKDSPLKMLRENVSRTVMKAGEDEKIDITLGLANLSFSGEGKIPGTGERTYLKAGTESVDVSVRALLIPVLSDEAWITAETSSLGIPLLNGRSNMYVDGSPGGTTTVKNYAVGEKFEMPFGRIPLLRAERKEYIDTSGTSWTGKGRLVKGYTIKVFNGLKSKRDITILDRIPVSADEDIEVEILEISPEVSEKSEDSILKWERQILPGETLEIKVKYLIKYPGDKEIEIRSN